MGKTHITYFLLFIVAICAAQEPLRFTTRNGLPSNTVYDIQEDKEGFMWFATNRGVVKFDGDTFTTFTSKDGLPNNDTWKLDVDEDNRVWYMSKSNYQGYIKNDSVYKFKVENNEVISPTSHKKTNRGIQLLSVSSFYLEDNIWKKDKDLLEEFKSVTAAFPGERFYFITKGLYLIDLEGYLQIYSVATKHLTRLPIPKINSDASTTLYGSWDEENHYVHLGHGIFFMNAKTQQYKYHSYPDNVEPLTIKCNKVDNRLQVTYNETFLFFDENFELLEEKKFPGHSFNSGYKDSKGNTWLADLSIGITLFPAVFDDTHYFLKGESVQSIDAIDDVIYCGVKNKGFYTYSIGESSQATLVKSSKGNMYRVRKDSILGNLFIGDNINSNVKNQSIKINALNADSEQYEDYFGFKDIHTFKGRRYYIGSVFFGIENLDTQKAHVTNKLGLQEFIKHNDTLYVSGSNGLYYMQNDSLRRPKNTTPLDDIPITTMSKDGSSLFIGTDGYGFYRYRKQTLEKIENSEGLSIQRIIQRNNHLWLATQKGVQVFKMDTLNFSKSEQINAYYEEDGLLENNLNDIYLQDSILIAASDQGITRLTLHDKQVPKPTIYFKNKKEDLILTYEKNLVLPVSFGVINFSNQENLSYSYRLLPTVKEWITTDTKTLNLSNLSPGKYELEVRAIDQHQNSNSNSIEIKIKPRWWQTFWAKILFTIGGILAFALFGLIVKFQIKKNETNKTERDKRYATLELQALRSQMNPHFVHNSLNAIQYFIQRNEVELSEDYLSKFSKLIRLFFEYSRRQNLSLTDEIELLTNYLDMEKLRFEEKLTYEITVDSELDLTEYTIPSMILQPIVENAVNHGIFHKKGTGHISVVFERGSKDSFVVSIQDDGIGINAAKKIYNQSSKNYRSNSSTILQERLDLLKQSKSWDIDYTVTDLLETTEQSGTIVRLQFNTP